MTSSGWAHPLDVDLADLVDGRVEAPLAAELEDHLAGCLLCRIKRRRLRDAPPPGPGEPLPPATFEMPEVDHPGEPAPGEVWLAGGDERVLVLVVRIAGSGRALVVPVTLDVESADEETVVVDGFALHPALATDLALTELSGRLAVLAPSADVLALLDGARPGPPVTGADDPRLQIRQDLADRLGSLEEMAPDAGGSAGAPPAGTDDVRSALIAELRAWRGPACAVRPLEAWDGLVLAAALGWEPLATVDEVGVVLVVLDTPHGLADDRDFDAARSVLTRGNATALVVLSRGLSDTAEVFDSSSLHAGIDMPSGAHTPPRPLISGLVAFDAIAKFLDQHSGARAMSPPTRGPVARVDVSDVLRVAAATAAADVARQGSRFKIAPKRKGYESLAGATDSLGEALATAFTDGSVVEALQALAQVGDDG